MPFSINQMIVDGAKNVVALNWAYSNADGTLSNQHKLAHPYGDIPLEQVTEAVAIEMLESQLQNTTEEFDAAITSRKLEAAYAETLVPYVNDGAGAFKVAEEPKAEPEAPEVKPAPEPEAAVLPAPARKPRAKAKK